MHACVQDVEEEDRASMLVLSEFVGCSPSVSGAIRVNPWCVDDVADGIYAAIKMPLRDRHLRHAKHWRYVSQHTVKYWAQVCVAGNAVLRQIHCPMDGHNVVGCSFHKLVLVGATARHAKDSSPELHGADDHAAMP